MKVVSIHDVKSLIKQLENPIRSAKSKAAQQLSSLNIFPSVISNKDQFLHEVVAPIIFYLSDNTESVRENCLKAVDKCVDDLFKQIITETPSNFSELFLIIIPPLCSRLKNESIENSEQIRLYLLILLLKLVKVVTNKTIPNNLDTFFEEFIDPLSVSFKSNEPEMKKTGCELLDEILLRCSQEKLTLLSENLAYLVFSNCFHHHYEIRKKSLHSLALLYVSSGTFLDENTDKLINSLQKFSEDRNSNVRKEVIFFCSIILTRHSDKNKLYFPLLIPLLYFSSPLVPLHQTETNDFSKIQPKKATEESKLSFSALNEIGLSYTNSESKALEQRIFDDNHIANNGIIQIIHDFSEKFVNSLRLMIVDWTEGRRKYGYPSLITYLQICGSYVQRYSPHIMQSLQKSMHDNQENIEGALQCQAILSSFISGKEIVDFLCPQITNEGPKEVILLLTTSIINSTNNINDDILTSILNQCLNMKIYENVDLAENSIQLVLSMIQKSSHFTSQNSFYLSIFILKISEKTDALKFFINAFDKPLSNVFGDNLPKLLKYEEKTPMFLKKLFENCSKEDILKYQDSIVFELSSLLKSNLRNKPIIEDIINQLKRNKCLPDSCFTD